MRNNIGFPLVELLAVIVVLAIVMLIAVTSIGPIMEKARKSAFIDEGISMIDSAKLAYTTAQIDSGSQIKSNSTVCFSSAWLKSKGYFSKGEGSGDDTYKGSVLIKYEDGSYSYQYWLYDSAQQLSVIAGGPTNQNDSIVNKATSEPSNVTACGGETRDLLCSSATDC